jgi:aldehyde dehydrogenase (NAD+)
VTNADLLAPTCTFDRLFIGGSFVPSQSSGTIEVTDATTERVIGTVPLGGIEDVDRAVAAARAAWTAWSTTSWAQRAEHLARISAGLAAREAEIAEIISREVGTPIRDSVGWQAWQPAHVTGLYAELARTFDAESPLGNSLIRREPVGVVAAITPWNFPLHQTMLKVAPALASGNCVVLKPSSMAPLSSFVLAEVVAVAGLPSGVLNVVTGAGDTVGRALAAHPGVDLVSLTGSTAAGRAVAELAAASIKRVALELGGKSASLVLEDADLTAAVANSVSNCYANAGQTCAAWTRLIVPRVLLEDAESIAVATAAGYRVGPALDPETTMGPLISDGQRAGVRSAIRAAQADGARLLAGGADAPAGLHTGYFVRPTIFSDVDRAMSIGRDEIFGPVLSILAFDTEAEAVAIANDSIYGLSGAVWSRDRDHALRVARQLRTGQVFINDAPFNYLAPFGGYGQSGIGREFGRYALEEYTELKAMQLPVDPVAPTLRA